MSSKHQQYGQWLGFIYSSATHHTDTLDSNGRVDAQPCSQAWIRIAASHIGLLLHRSTCTSRKGLNLGIRLREDIPRLLARNYLENQEIDML